MEEEEDGPPPLEEAPTIVPIEVLLGRTNPPEFLRRWAGGETLYIQGPEFEAAKEKMCNATTKEEKIEAAKQLIGFMIITRPYVKIVPYAEGEKGTPMSAEEVRQWTGEYL